MKKVYVTRRIPDIGIRLLEERFDVAVYPGPRPIGRKELLRSVQDCHGIVTLLSEQMDAKVLQSARNLEIIANVAVGYNNIDIRAAERHGVMVTHTPDVLTNATGEIAFALLIALTRRILPADRFTRNGSFVCWDPLLFLGDELQGKTIGIIGMGRIGLDMAAKCRAFGMEVIYHARKPVAHESERRVGAVYCDLDHLLAVSDAISVHTPLTPATRHLLDEEAFRKMKPGVYLINTSRGEVIHEKALVENLKTGRVKGAGLDVYEFEPQITPELLSMENVILLPHIGSATVETRNRMAEMAARNVLAALEGNRPPNLVPEMAERL